MKLIKKIAAIMFAFMMVVSMSCNVKAAGTGKITIDNAKKDETYTIYQVLTLESSDVEKGLYSYIPVNDAWKAYFKTEEGKKYMTVDDNGYVTTKYTETNAQELAQALIKQAKTINYNPQSITPDKDGTIEFTGLALGYYVVDTTVGTLCGLNTANPEITIQDKNKKPTVEKKIVEGEQLVDNNSANIGDVVNFKTTITAQAGAQDYVLHDTMDEGFTFTNNIQVKLNDSKVENQDYSIYLKGTENNKTTDGCTFEIRFTKDFCDKLKENDIIYVTYTAMLNSKAFIGINNNDASGNTNATKITYGANNKESVESKTQTYTYQIPVFKYTGIGKTPLAGATFSLFTTETEGDAIKLVQKTGTQEYRLAIQGETGEKEVTEITTTDTERFSIQGLKPGNYWLEETAAPKGYNKLKKRIKIAVGAHGAITIDGNYNADGTVSGGNLEAEVGVENKTGTVLPSTGGAGTTMIYLIGGALVLGSGVVLATKRRVKNK